MNDGEKSTAYEGWAIVDLFGHVKLAGKVSEAQQYGTTMLRIDVPSVDGSAAFTKFVGGAAIYSLVPTTQEIAEGVIRRQRPVPVNPYEMAVAPKLGAIQDGEEVAPSSCRRCSECIGQGHHWIENDEVFGPEDPDLVCKHCDAKAFKCIDCDDRIVGGPDQRCAECAADAAGENGPS